MSNMEASNEHPPETNSESLTTHNFSFHGSAKEYFGIWIVNLILTVLTLGIYSAWAKVRTNRYLYGNTDLAGSRFEYHASPITILKGRLIAMLFIAVYIFGDSLFPGTSLILLLIILLIFPWIMVRSLKFRAVNSSWRGIRFTFRGSTKGAYGCSSKGGLLTFFTGGFAYPVALFWLKQFQVNDHHFGHSKFSLHADAGDYFKIYLKSWGLYILSVIAALLLLFSVGIFDKFSEFAELLAEQETAAQQDEYQYDESYEESYEQQRDAAFERFEQGDLADESEEDNGQAQAGTQNSTNGSANANPSSSDEDAITLVSVFMALYLLIFVVFGFIYFYVQVRTLNLIWSNTKLDQRYSFNSFLPLWGVVKLQLGNTIGVLLSLGLLIPWAVIRTLRFRLEHLNVEGPENLDQFIADEAAQLDAAGEEIGEAFDLDFGL